MVPLAKLRNTPQFAEHAGSSPYSPQPATCHTYPDPTYSNPTSRYIWILPSHQVLQVAPFLRVYRQTLFVSLFSLGVICSAHFTLLYLRILRTFWGRTNREHPHYAISSSFLSFPSTSKYSPWHPVLEHPHAMFVLHTHTEQVNYGSVYFNLYVFIQ